MGNLVRIIEWATRDWTKVHTYSRSVNGTLDWLRTDLVRN